MCERKRARARERERERARARERERERERESAHARAREREREREREKERDRERARETERDGERARETERERERARESFGPVLSIKMMHRERAGVRARKCAICALLDRDATLVRHLAMMPRWSAMPPTALQTHTMPSFKCLTCPAPPEVQ